MKTIIFPSDFSELTHSSLEFAANYCQSIDARLIIQNSFFAMAQESGLSNEIMQTLITNAENDSKHGMDHLKAEMKSKYPNLQVEYYTKFGFPIDNIVDACKEFDADMVIWMDTVKRSEYKDTNKIFQKPKEEEYDMRIDEFASDKWSETLADLIHMLLP